MKHESLKAEHKEERMEHMKKKHEGKLHHGKKRHDGKMEHHKGKK